MVYPIEKKFVVAVSSRALFNLDEANDIYEKKGLESYKKHQEQNLNKILDKGRAFPFIRRFLNINKVYEQDLVEVVLLSRNSAETGLRVFRSIREHDLNISRAVFLSGESPFPYLPAFNVTLFLSINEEDVKQSIEHRYPAGLILDTPIEDDEEDTELRVAFDFDGVVADDSAEKIYKENKEIAEFHKHEQEHVKDPLPEGILKEFLQRLSAIQNLETFMMSQHKNQKRLIKTSIVTARNAPAHERVINTLKAWDVAVDSMFLLGGIEKKRVLQILKPHLYLDDQKVHLDKTLSNIPLVHIPFGIANQ